MKKTIFAAMAAAISTVLIFASCAKDEQIPANNYDNFALNISFKAADSGLDITRAFFEEGGITEMWERTVNNVTAYIFNSSGGFIVQRVFTPEEVTAGNAIIGAPFAMPGETYSIHLVANKAAEMYTDESALLAATVDTPSDYNGTAEEIILGQKLVNGFVMTSYYKFTVPDNASPINFGLTLNRIVAKLAVKTVYDFASGNTLEGGDLRITNVSIQGAATQSSLVNYGDNYNTGNMTFSHSQTPKDGGDHLQNVFYIYENPALNIGDTKPEHSVFIVFDGIYDEDGDWMTTKDQSSVQYKTLAGHPTNKINRGTYYRITAKVRGLPGAELNSSFVAGYWSWINIDEELGV